MGSFQEWFVNSIWFHCVFTLDNKIAKFYRGEKINTCLASPLMIYERLRLAVDFPCSLKKNEIAISMDKAPWCYKWIGRTDWTELCCLCCRCIRCCCPRKTDKFIPFPGRQGLFKFNWSSTLQIQRASKRASGRVGGWVGTKKYKIFWQNAEQLFHNKRRKNLDKLSAICRRVKHRP